MTGHRDARSELPSVDRVLQASQDLVSRWGHQAASDAIRKHLRRIREDITAGKTPDWSIPAVHAAVNAALSASDTNGLRPVINLSGVVIHTNLGRACLPAGAAEAASQAAMLPNNLEFDLETGQRGNRDNHIESLICELTGSEAATVVNNNAAAVVLALSTLAKGREVPVSRGELVEIGGSFRVPEVMESSGCTLVEVGATNRTHLKDYRSAVSAQTALLMKVHTSNYRLEGFTQSVDEKTLAELAHEHKLPCMVDLGSGCLIDFADLGLPGEPKASDYIANGIDLITFSGDKLLGGPQCGIIAGKKSLLDRICKNPLKRALRVDSMILAALSEVLKLYRHPETLTQTLPTLRQLTRPASDIEEQAVRLCSELANHLPQAYRSATAPCYSQIGSGALPVETIPSFAIAIESAEDRDSDLRRLATELRKLPRPVIGRIHDGRLLLDLRCLDCESLFLEQLPLLENALAC
ncbi:L-seryl-tRNA(Sec) selenium transferase [Seongchinamella sediminis]|uniref:L-seryl-tRNA(Sec) selenium transferase n=1 Tax=Seongchinamella sediminis TaxID=2283635 RepID=A0A3L7DT43_9GAMM|nr:L-seryl-tRNA(Sec) selenium transferase [Seongchinamella sediminis]RLQ20718.1 L-seryl-tRNA(Sec) selenium transferase [Seongchinamella sediminis]